MIVWSSNVPLALRPLVPLSSGSLLKTLTQHRFGSDRIVTDQHLNWSSPPTPTLTQTQSQPERLRRAHVHDVLDGASWGSQVPNCFRLLSPVHSFFSPSISISISYYILLLLSLLFFRCFFLFCLIDFCVTLCVVCWRHLISMDNVPHTAQDSPVSSSSSARSSRSSQRSFFFCFWLYSEL